MNFKHLYGYTVVVGMMLSSCIGDEAPNAECDIVTATLDNSFVKGNPIIENDIVTFYANPLIDLDELAPEFTLTPGATISPASGTIRNFNEPQYYTVTAEDGVWQKEYKVMISVSAMKTVYDFEHYEKKSNYYVFFEVIDGVNQYIWASGNAGYQMAGGGSNPLNYPTTIDTLGIKGTAALLRTKSTGSFGAMVGMPLAAGNLFIGTFEVSNAIKNPLGATLFGHYFGEKPARLKGWYKYDPGKKFTNKQGATIINKTDSMDIYSVLYEPTEEIPSLDGANVLTAPNIIAIARLTSSERVTEFREFNLPFYYFKDLDQDKLLNNEYKLTIVFTSSKDGAYFEGAEGSTLIIDEVELICDIDDDK